MNNFVIAMIGKFSNGTALALWLALMLPSFAMATPSTITPGYVDSAGRAWAPLWATWSVLPERFLAVCDSTTGRCSGTLTDESVLGDQEIDLTGWVWASRQESLNLVSEATSIPVATLTEDPDGWYLPCDFGDGWSDKNCPPEFSAFANFVEANATRHGSTSISFNGVSRDDFLRVYEGHHFWSGWGGYWVGECCVSFYEGWGDVEGVRTDCVPEWGGPPTDDECWAAWGHFLYLPADVSEPRAQYLFVWGVVIVVLLSRSRRVPAGDLEHRKFSRI